MKQTLFIFEHKKGFFITTESLVLILLTGIVFLLGYLQQTDNFDFGNWFAYIAIIWIIYLVGYMIHNFFSQQRKNGEFNGKLELDVDTITINGAKFELNEISKILIRSTDYEGQFLPNQFALARNSSNGLNNEMILYLVNGKEIKCHFLQTKGQRIKNYKNLLINYHLKEKLSWLHLLDVLEMKDYNEIQNFKRELKEKI
jgi:hypothetical protein